MWRFLVALGFLLALAGLVVAALGIAIFVSSFGNTLIATGAVSLSGGIVIIAVAMVLKELRELSERLDAILAPGATFAPAPAHDDTDLEPAHAAFEPEEAYEPEPEPEPLPIVERPAEPPRPAPPPFLRTRGFGRPETTAALDPAVAPPLPDALRRGRILGRPGETDTGRMRPPIEPPLPAPAAEPEAAPEPVRPPAPERTVRGFAPPPPPPAAAPPAAPPAARRPDPASEPSVLKSGIVGGMAYTLYTDGSIEAELPDGTLRFGSLQELRDHVARTSQR
ncbi:hypothetical protein [Aquabacter spiritensis]|uniref:DUF308 domain-containing protein n=1 Tax=Aquabacter spiritensis TaxID=933073 RepID=A0A4R3LQY6_9HYPH|nr:hypothetical protein [Aquabacter spiritensis]TCT02984.1 hypothetical protein EDC64_111156 [Aquabacter spiritensis]